MPNNEKENLENILSQLSRQQNDLNKLREDYSALKNHSALNAEWLVSSAKAEAINHGREVENRLNEKNKSSLNSIKILIGLGTFFISFFGYFGMQAFIDHAVEKGFTEEIQKRVAKTERKTLNSLTEAEKLYKDIYRTLGKFKNDLVVLQTDYGARSPYMGVLKGVIYHVNPNARIDVITDEVSAFEYFDAAWILSKAVEHYPKHTIFVSITGDPGEDALPVILRDKKKGHTFVGYLNGVFDIVKPLDGGFDNQYTVNKKKLVNEVRKHQQKLLPESVLKKDLDSDSNIHLGLIAGILSKMPAPWEKNYDKEKNFSWDHIVKNVDYTGPVEFAKIKPELIETQPESQNSIVIEGTIMNIDRYGNANTNIPKVFLEKELAKKNLTLDSAIEFNVGIGNAKDFSKLHGSKLKKIKFSKDYSTIDKYMPLITEINGKLQLAINQGDLSRSPMLLVSDTENQKNENARFIKPQMKVWIMIRKRTLPVISINQTEEDEEKISGDTNKR